MNWNKHKHITWRRFLLLGAAVAVAFAAWFLLAPPPLGGSTSYVMTAGTSMEPGFHTGDLVLVRKADAYQVGDVAAYESTRLKTVVLHRIVAAEDGHYVFKGDSNAWLDPERPGNGELAGKVWLHVPGAGELFEFRSPRTIGLLAGVGMLLLLGGAGAAAKRRRNRRRRADAEQARPRSYAPVRAAGPLLGVSSLALVFLLALGGLAFARPLTASVTGPAFYEQSGSFSYSASTARGPVYADGRVQTGEPLFLRVVDQVNVRFAYRLRSQAPRSVHGRATLAAKLSEASGWTRGFELRPATAFEGDEVVLAGKLDLARVRALREKFESATGVTGAYTLTLVPTVRLDGLLAGTELKATFSPELEFAFDQVKLTPTLSAPQSDTAPSAETAADPLDPVESGSVEARTQAPTILSAGRLQVEVATARRAALIGVGASLALLLLAAALLWRGRRADEPARIRARYGSLLISVERSDRRSYDEIVEVSDMETLVRLAERYDRMILHEESELGLSYRVADEGVLYVYLVGNPGSGELPPLPIPSAPKTPPASRPTPG
jgi:signal peptidase I